MFSEWLEYWNSRLRETRHHKIRLIFSLYIYIYIYIYIPMICLLVLFGNCVIFFFCCFSLLPAMDSCHGCLPGRCPAQGLWFNVQNAQLFRKQKVNRLIAFTWGSFNSTAHNPACAFILLLLSYLWLFSAFTKLWEARDRILPCW